MEIFNLPFWVFVAVIAGIYTIFALGLYLQYALAGLPNFGHVASAALAAVQPSSTWRRTTAIRISSGYALWPPTR